MVGRGRAASGRDTPDFLVVGVVRKPHGVRGAVTITTATDHPGEVFSAGRRLRVGDGAGRPVGGTVTIRAATPHKGGYLVHFEGIEELGERVEALRGRTLLIAAEEAVSTAPDEFFFHELVGLEVVRDGEPVGRVREVVELPSGIAVAVRSGRREVLVPFVRSIVRRVSVGEGVIEIDPPEGLLEL